MIGLRSNRNVFRSSIRCAEPDCEGLCCPPNSFSSPWKCQICQAERSSQQVMQNNAKFCNRMHIRSHFRTCVTFTWQGGWADVLCGGRHGRFGLLQRSTPTRADDQQACFCSACVTCNFKLDNISVSFKVLGSPGSSSQPLSGCWTLSQPRLCLRSSQAGWFLLHFSTLNEAQDFKFSFQAEPFKAWAGASYTDQLPHSFGENKSY